MNQISNKLYNKVNRFLHKLYIKCEENNSPLFRGGYWFIDDITEVKDKIQITLFNGLDENKELHISINDKILENNGLLEDYTSKVSKNPELYIIKD